jgi:hypothetical protein
MVSATDAAPAGILAGFITPDDLATQLHISRRTLDRWHARRIGPARCTVGRLILYRADAVRDWLVKQESPAPERDARRR